VNATCRTSLAKPENINDGNILWLLDEFEKFTRHLSLKRAISKSVDLLENNEYGEMELLIKDAAQIGLARDMGTDYFSDPKLRLTKIKDTNGQMPTLWDELDKLLYGGFNRKELEIFAAQSGGGKSLFLANLCINYASAKLTVVYISLELSEELVCLRIDAMMTGMSTKEVFKNIDDTELKIKMLGRQYGGIQVKYIPSGKTVNDIRSYLKEFEVTFNKKVDVLAVDYLDLLMPISKKISAENLFIKDKFVSEELRNLAHEKNCLIISAAQLNRSSVDDVEFDHSHISGGLSKIQTADNVFAIYTSRAMRERGRYQLQLLKTRNSSGVGQKIDLEFNVDSLRITGVNGDSSEAIQPSTNSIIENIKRKTSLAPPTEDKKVTVEVSSSKIRNLLNNMAELNE
jgi:archaellum biogenesis ATPase FlaH